MAKAWHIWSWDHRNRIWLDVGEGTKQFARDGAARKTAAAVKYEVSAAAYVALPSGSVPDAEPAEVTPGPAASATAERMDAAVAVLFSHGVRLAHGSKLTLEQIEAIAAVLSKPGTTSQEG